MKGGESDLNVKEAYFQLIFISLHSITFILVHHIHCLHVTCTICRAQNKELKSSCTKQQALEQAFGHLQCSVAILYKIISFIM